MSSVICNTVSAASSLVFVLSVITLLSISAPYSKSNVVEGSSSRRLKDLSSTFNKTLRERMRTQDFKARLEARVKPQRSKGVMPRNWMVMTKAPSTPTYSAGVRPPPPPLSTRTSHVQMRSGRDRLVPREDLSRKLPIVRAPTPKTIFPSLIYAHKIERNTLTFTMQPNIVGGKKIVSLHLWVFVWKREPKRISRESSSPQLSMRELKKQTRRKNRRNKVIKIRVFTSNKSGDKGKRIAELKKKIQTSRYQTIALPISLVKSMSTTPNSTFLHIRVECSRCNRKTRLVLPGNENKKRCRKRRRSRRRKDKSKRKLRRKRRRNCAKARSLDDDRKGPFIVVEKKNEARSSRFKRSPSTSPVRCDSRSMSSPKMPHADSDISNHTSGSTASCCQKLETYISFKDLNLENDIVYPSGFHYVTCSSSCPKDNKKRRQLLNVQRDFIRNEILEINSNPPSLQPQAPVHTKVSRIVNRSRLKEASPGSKCLPSQKRGLHLLHFNPDFSLVQTELPDFLVSECQCNSS